MNIFKLGLLCSLLFAAQANARDWLHDPLTPMGNVSQRANMMHVACYSFRESKIYDATVMGDNVRWVTGVLYIVNNGDWKQIVYSTNAACTVTKL
jgi:hypothetical protein